MEEEYAQTCILSQLFSSTDEWTSPNFLIAYDSPPILRTFELLPTSAPHDPPANHTELLPPTLQVPTDEQSIDRPIRHLTIKISSRSTSTNKPLRNLDPTKMIQTIVLVNRGGCGSATCTCDDCACAAGQCTCGKVPLLDASANELLVNGICNGSWTWNGTGMGDTFIWL